MTQHSHTHRLALRLALRVASIAGTLDIAAAVVYYSLHGGRQPVHILLYIASALLGDAAYRGVVFPAAAIGLIGHYLAALGWTIVFLVLMKNKAWRTYNPWSRGAVYGILVWCGMNLVVVPISRAEQAPLVWPDTGISMGILIVAFGIPISLMAGCTGRR